MAAGPAANDGVFRFGSIRFPLAGRPGILRGLMIEPTPRPNAALHDVPGQRYAVRLGLALLAGLLWVAVATLRDNAHRTQLETAQELTAVGDKRYFVPSAADGRAVAATMNGQPLSASGAGRHSAPDTEMRRIAKDEATGLAIYQPAARRQQGGGEDGELFFLKIGPGEFVRASPSFPPK